MPIYYENFETFSVGATTPIGSFTAGGASIVADNYLTTGSRAMRTDNNLTNAQYSPGLQTSATIYVAWKQNNSNANNQSILDLNNGTHVNANLFSLRNEGDNTLSVFISNNGTFAGNTHDFVISDKVWSWLQLNVTMFSVSVSGTNMLAIDFELGVNGTSVISNSITTNRPISLLDSGTPQWDQLLLNNSSIWDEFTLDSLQPINTYPNPGTPAARATTGLTEILELVDSASVRATTGLIEILVSDKNLRVQEC